MILLLAVVAAVGVGLVAIGAPLGRRAFLVAAAALALVGVWVTTQLGRVVDGRPPTAHASWVDGLGLTIDLRLDGAAAIMHLVVTVVGVAVLLYATRYFSPDAPDLGRLAGLLVLFAGAMVGLVLADQLFVLYTCWELTSITSYLLIGNRHTESRARAAALQALLVTGAGGLALLAGFVLLGQAAGTYRLSTLLTHPPPDTTTVKVALVLILIGALTKSAQYPFHAWLPGAMAAPTPVSAYLHSATMVKAGVFLVGWFAPTFAAVGPWRPLVFAAGGCSLLFGGLRALRQHDLKVLLAFGTVSQLGLLMILFGAGTPTLATAGWVLLIAHAAFKATLFMVVGIVDHQTGTRDLRRLPALRAGWGATEVVTILAAASMAGIPLGAGFVAKELAYDGLAHARFAAHVLVEVVVVVGSMFTVAYAARFWWGAFPGPRRRATAAGVSAAGQAPAAAGSVVAPAPSASFLAPAAVLALAGVVFGVAPAVENRLVAAASAVPVRLELWHGLNLPLLLSAVTLAGGAALFLGDAWLQPQLARGGAIPSGSEIYTGTLRGVGTGSSRLTGLVQNGSLPIYAGVILLTAAVLPAGALLVGHAWAGWPPFGPFHELPVLGVLVVAGFGAAVVRRRFDAAVFLGVAGYAMAGVFVLSGAPDLALTQAAVETLSTVVFVLVLRRLPEHFERQSSPQRRVVRLAIAGGVGVMVFGFALVAAGHRISPPGSEQMVARSLPDGHGRNVVNVILVDFRGFDTLGEISVLAVASIGAVALARAGRRAADVARAPS